MAVLVNGVACDCCLLRDAQRQLVWIWWLLWLNCHITTALHSHAYQEPPHPPSSLKFSEIMPKSVLITWNYNVNPGDVSYVIQYKAVNVTQDYTDISGIVTMFYTVSGLTPSTEYEFYVLAVNNFGNGLPSEPLLVTTSDIGFPRPPSLEISNITPPSSLEFSDVTSTSVWLTWNYKVNPGNISYVIQYKPNDVTQDYTDIFGIFTKSYTVSGLTPSTEYEFYVLAVNNIGKWSPSEPSYVTTIEIGDINTGLEETETEAELSKESYSRKRRKTYGCPTGYVQIGTRCYIFSSQLGEHARTQSEARFFCLHLSRKKYSIDLATLGHGFASDEDPLLKYIQDNDLAASSGLWLGAVMHSGSFWWIDGRTLAKGSHLWRYSEPSWGGESCVALYAGRPNNNVMRLYIDDEDCDSKFGFVCESKYV